MSDSMTECVIPRSSAKSCSFSMCTPRTYCATRSNHGLNSEQVFSWLLLSSESYLRHKYIAYKSTYTPYTHCNFLKLQINKYKYYQLISIFFTSAAAKGHHKAKCTKGLQTNLQKRARAQSGRHQQAPVGLRDNFKMFSCISLQNTTAAFDLRV